MVNISDFVESPPEQIINAINENKFAIFFGNGLSRLIGVESFKTLVENLTTRLVTEGKIEPQLKAEIDRNNPKKAMTVCKRQYEKFDMIEIYHEEKRVYLKEDEIISQNNVYDDLYKMRGFFLTTNVDTKFDRFFQENNILIKLESFLKEKQGPEFYAKLHGSEADISTEVFTYDEYKISYDSEEFKNYLSELFKNYTILIIGTEFEEDLILQNLANKNSDQYFILVNISSEEHKTVKQSYYQSLGITPIFYDVSDQNWFKLESIIKKWADEINERSQYYVNTFERIIKFIENPSDDELNKIEQVINKEQVMKNFFYGSLANCTNPINILECLERNGYFNPKKNPKPVYDSENNVYRYKYWRILHYILNLGKQLDKEDLEENIRNNIQDFISRFIDENLD